MTGEVMIHIYHGGTHLRIRMYRVLPVYLFRKGGYKEMSHLDYGAVPRSYATADTLPKPSTRATSRLLCMHAHPLCPRAVTSIYSMRNDTI